MRTYTIEVHTVPQEFTISANSGQEAVERAVERFKKSDIDTETLESRIVHASQEWNN